MYALINNGLFSFDYEYNAIQLFSLWRRVLKLNYVVLTYFIPYDLLLIWYEWFPGTWHFFISVHSQAGDTYKAENDEMEMLN